MDARTISILLVEDDDVDAEAVVRAFRHLKIANPIVNARDGREALDTLRGTNGMDRLPRPFLILLDLNMPRMSGLEFLDEVRADEELRDSIVFVLTTSNLDRDKVAAYGHNVAGYVVKTKLADNFIEMATMVDSYWRLVEFPPVP